MAIELTPPVFGYGGYAGDTSKRSNVIENLSQLPRMVKVRVSNQSLLNVATPLFVIQPSEKLTIYSQCVIPDGRFEPLNIDIVSAPYQAGIGMSRGELSAAITQSTQKEIYIPTLMVNGVDLNLGRRDANRGGPR